MKVLVVMDSASRIGGGLLEAERALHRTLGGMAVETSVQALRDEFSQEDGPTWAPIQPSVHASKWPSALGRSTELHAAILRSDADLAYRVGLWRLPSRYLQEWKRKTGKPEIIAPHGMLDPWAVGNSRWKKRLAKWWFEGEHLRGADCLRALCESEARSIRAYGLTNPTAIITNGVDLPTGVERRAESRERKTVLFLGRLHPKKGLANALRAWKAKSEEWKEWQFVIAGWDQAGHEAELKRLCDELGLIHADVPAEALVQRATDNRQSTADNHASVLFVGPAFGAAKDHLLRHADAFILPSFSEGLPMAVLEAWAYGLPVLMTDHCNLPEGFQHDAAIRIGTEVGSIAQGMADLIQSPISDLRSLGRNGRVLVERQFTWPRVARQMKELYEWVLGGGERPSFVTTR